MTPAFFDHSAAYKLVKPLPNSTMVPRTTLSTHVNLLAMFALGLKYGIQNKQKTLLIGFLIFYT